MDAQRTAPHRHADDAKEAAGVRALLPAIGLLALGLAGLLVATVWPDRADSRYMLVAPPWFDSAQTMALAVAADGRIVRVAGLPNLLIVQSDDPAFPAALRQAGAWLVLSGLGVRGCAGSASA